VNNPEDVFDLETPKSDMSEIAAACKWLNLEEDKMPAGILQIVAGCLKDIKKVEIQLLHQNGNSTHCSH
jgi:hypothetical protein